MTNLSQIILLSSSSHTTQLDTYLLDNQRFNSAIINNAGNLVFINAIENIILNPIKYYTDLSIDEVNKNSCIVIPSANWISSTLDISQIINYLQQINIPMIFLGLGVQANSYDETEINLHDSAKKLLKLLKSKECIVGCRGEFTQNFLTKYGVESTIIGCVSNFKNYTDNFISNLYHKWNNSSNFCVGVGNDINTKCPIRLQAEQNIFKFATEQGFYLQQSYITAINSIRKNNLYAHSYNSNDLFLKLGSHCKSKEEFDKLLANNTRIYVSIQQWMEDISRMDLCFGTRIHGNILAQQAGCPSIVIYHDSRTRELAETMGYNRISVEDFVNIKSIQHLKDSCHYNFEEYANKRKILKQNFVNMVSKYGIKIK